MNQKIQTVGCREGTGAKCGQGKKNGEGKRQSRDGGAACVPCFHLPAPSLCTGSVWVDTYTQVKFRYFYPPTLFLNVVSSNHILRESWWWFFPFVLVPLHLSAFVGGDWTWYSWWAEGSLLDYTHLYTCFEAPLASAPSQSTAEPPVAGWPFPALLTGTVTPLGGRLGSLGVALVRLEEHCELRLFFHPWSWYHSCFFLSVWINKQPDQGKGVGWGRRTHPSSAAD